MAKGYWVANSDVIDMAGMQRYRDANQAALARHNPKFIVLGGRHEVREGTSRSRQTIVEFESYAAALAAYDDPEYQAAALIRGASAVGDMVIVEGFDMPPGR